MNHFSAIFTTTIIYLLVLLYHQHHVYGDSNVGGDRKYEGFLGPIPQEAGTEELTDEESLQRATESWVELSRWTRKITEDLLKKLMPRIVEMSHDLDVSPQCTVDIMKVIVGLREQKPWAIKFIDSMFRPTSGFFDGTVTDFGDYDQCVNIVGPSTSRDTNTPAFHGHYCLMIVRPKMPNMPRKISWKTELFNFTGTELEGTILEELSKSISGIYQVPGRLGVCVPSSCTVQDMEEISMLINAETNLWVEAPETCHLKKDPYRISTYQAVSISGILILTTLVVIGTMLDIRYRSTHDKKPNFEEGGLLVLLLAFSAKINCEKLFRIEYNPANLPALHGMRFFTIFWAVIVHTYGFGSFSPWLYRNLLDLVRRTESAPYQLLSNAFVLVDTFFMIGGLTLVYVTFPLLEKHRGRINIPMYVLHRWFRMVPTVTGAIFLNSLLPFFMDSPYEPEIGFIYEACERNWWANYLFIQNWFSGRDMCLIQAWYISADTQLYLLALAILIPLYWRPKLAMGLIGVSCLVACIASGFIVYWNDLPATVLFRYMSSFDAIDQFCQMTYYPTYEHISPYFIGMLVGYLIYKYRTVVLGKSWVALGWIVSSVAMIGVLFIPLSWSQGVDPGPEIAGLYQGLHRSVWALAVAWVVFACVTGRGGLVNSILTARWMVPISRLGFGMYLLQIPLIAIRITNKAKDTQVWTDLEMISQSISNFAWTFVLALFLNMLCEAPFATLEKLAMKKLMGGPKETRQPTNNQITAQEPQSQPHPPHSRPINLPTTTTLHPNHQKSNV